MHRRAGHWFAASATPLAALMTLAVCVVDVLIQGSFGAGAAPAEPSTEFAEPQDNSPLVAPGPAADMLLAYTGGVVGYVEPCGCPKNPAGGLARRAGYLKLFKDDYPSTVVVLAETGDFAGDPGEAGRVKTENLIEGMTSLGYDVVNVGEKELAAGIPLFLEIAGRSGMTFINSNFVYRDNGQTLFAPFSVREFKLASGRTARLGFLGVNALNSAFAREGEDGRIVVMRDPVEVVKAYVPVLRQRADMVVLLANLSLRDLSTVLAAAPGVDLALASYGPRISPAGQLETVAGVPVLYAGDQGKRFGEVRLDFPESGGPKIAASGHVFLTPRYPAEPKLQGLIDSTIARVNEINRSRAEKMAAGPVTPSRASEPMPGGAAVDHGAVTPDIARPYQTANACAVCHGPEHDIYLQSAHAHAYDTLVKANQDFNAECVKCHVTGFEQPLGFVNGRQSPDLANVQCEACHGNASAHVEDPSRPYGNVPPRTCFTCHTKENSPDFVFFKYWDKIKH